LIASSSGRFAGRATLILLPLIVSACTGNPAATAASSTSSAATASAASSPAGYRVVFTASTTGGSEVFLYDSASSAPQQLVSLAAGVPPDVQFVSSQKIAYTDSVNQAASRIVTVDLSTRASTAAVTASGYVPAFAYSHDGSMLAYLVHDTTGKAALHVRRSGQESTLNLNPIPGRGTGRDDEARLEYGPDDKYLLMVDTFVGNQGQAPETGQFLVLRTTDNSVAFVPPSGVSSNATMATWARRSDRLYYRDQVGVRTWDADATSVSTLATALHWYDPAVSPDDRWIAYTEIDAQFVPHVRLFDLQTNQTASTAGAARSHPIFLTADLIWYLEEQPCQSECLGGPSQTSGKVMAYNLKSKSETALPFSDVHSLSQLAVSGR
jgi:Tol biopolymer transport system component